MIAAFRRSLVPALIACTAGASCAEAPPPPPTVAKSEPTAPVAAVPPPMPARWVESAGTTTIGPQIGRDTLVLLGGRRALVLPDGTVQIERVPTPEALLDIALVPIAGGTRLVGRGVHDVYRFDDPLGAPVLLTRSEAALVRLGTAPGAVALWSARYDLPRFIDVETGNERPLKGLPDPPLRAISFLDAQRGAGVFEAVGLAVTTDGGATWRASAGGTARESLAVSGLRRRGDTLRAFGFADGPDAAIDLDRAHLGAMEPPAAAASDPLLLRWIRASGRDPLEAAASAGLELPTGNGGALIASHGMIARIDARTGVIGELVEISRGKWVPCSAGRAASTAWVACTLPDTAGTPGSDVPTRIHLFDPFGVFHVPLGEPKLAPDRPVFVRNGDADLRVSASGGVLLTGQCATDDVGQACVRQPDGKWKSINANVELTERGPGPLADGRVAFLRGLFDGDDEGGAAAPGDDDDAGPVKRLHVALLGPNGKEHALAPIPLVASRGYVHVQSPIEEDTDHALHFVIEDGDGPFSVVVPPTRETPTLTRIPDAAEARLHAGRGLAVGENHVLATLDNGTTWNEVPTTPAALEAARAIATGAEGPETFSVSDIGARLGPVLRLGWGPSDSVASADAPPAPAPLASLAAPAAPPASELVLVCASTGPSPGVPPLLGMADAKALLVGKPAPATSAKPAPKRDTSIWAARINALETVAMVEEDAPDKKGSGPIVWTLRWHDPREIGGKVRTATVKLAPGAAGGPNLRFAAADGARALFAVRSGGKFRLVRVKPGGAAEAMEVAQDLIPSGEVVFGTGKGDPIAWLHDSSVVAWLAGEKPRVIAELSSHAARTLGTPTAAGVPLLVGANDWALLRTLPIPPLDKAAPDKAPAAIVLPLDGWTRLPPIRRNLGSFPVCAARGKGHDFLLDRSVLRTEIDGISGTGATTRYAVRVNGNDICVQGLSATLTVSKPKGASPPATPPKGGRPPPNFGNTLFVRADLTGKKAEGGNRGLLPEAEVHRMKCTLEPKRDPR
ncbi:hypothetical protein A7982_13357 [Minicystis rosea]|nr:hypothetical protein A7982_13357 [Minicystis rosea]